MKKYHGIIVMSAVVEARNATDAAEIIGLKAAEVSENDRFEVIKITTDVHAHENEGLDGITQVLNDIFGKKPREQNESGIPE